MNDNKILKKYYGKLATIRNSQKSLRELAKDVKLSVNTLRRIKEALKTEKQHAKTVRKTIRFLPYELEILESEAKKRKLDFTAFARHCLFKEIESL